MRYLSPGADTKALPRWAELQFLASDFWLALDSAGSATGAAADSGAGAAADSGAAGAPHVEWGGHTRCRKRGRNKLLGL